MMQMIHGKFTIYITGFFVMCGSIASAQERTADYDSREESQENKIRPVFHSNLYGHSWNNYNNPWANYAPGYYTYPIHRDPNRGYVAYSSNCGGCCLFGKCCASKGNCDECKSDVARRVRCSLAWLRPLTYWDFGCQQDIIALDPAYSHPNDMYQAYAAQGFGGPVTVPLAPNVRSAYNYSWGLPSSRLTQINYPAPR